MTDSPSTTFYEDHRFTTHSDQLKKIAFVGAAPGLRNLIHFGGVGSSHELCRFFFIFYRGKMPHPQEKLQLPSKSSMLERAEQFVQLGQRGVIGCFNLLHRRHPAGKFTLQAEGGLLNENLP
jgi:hypothetical protein